MVIDHMMVIRIISIYFLNENGPLPADTLAPKSYKNFNQKLKAG